MKHRSNILTAVVGLITAVLPHAVTAWGPEGHTIIADIAAHYLNPRARQQVRAILGDLSLGDYEVASWPDIIRGNREYEQVYPKNSRWHYIDFDVFAPPDTLRTSEDGLNIVDQITYWRGELARKRVPRSRKLDALRFLVHFVGDVHQPLHCAYRYNDAGGNFIPVQSFQGAHFTLDPNTPMDRLPNLHSVWDEYLVYEMMDGLDPARVARQLIGEITPEMEKQWTAGDPLAWALESHQLARDRAYLWSDGTHLPFTWGRPGMDLTRENYIDVSLPVAREQLQKAGVRLAHLLNTTLDRPSRP